MNDVHLNGKIFSRNFVANGLAVVEKTKSGIPVQGKVSVSIVAILIANMSKLTAKDVSPANRADCFHFISSNIILENPLQMRSVPCSAI